jgi:hypothetical protein
MALRDEKWTSLGLHENPIEVGYGFGDGTIRKHISNDLYVFTARLPPSFFFLLKLDQAHDKLSSYIIPLTNVRAQFLELFFPFLNSIIQFSKRVPRDFSEHFFFWVNAKEMCKRKFSFRKLLFNLHQLTSCVAHFFTRFWRSIPDHSRLSFPFEVDSKFPVSQKLQMNFNSIFLERTATGSLVQSYFCVIFIIHNDNDIWIDHHHRDNHAVN